MPPASSSTSTPEPAKDAQPILTGADVLTFFEFFRDAFIPLQGIELPLKYFHKEICDTLEDAFMGNLPESVWFVIINMPPRTGKTKILEAWGCWAESVFPDAQFIYTSYSGDLAERSLSYISQTMRGPNWYTELFGDLVHGSRADHLSTTNGGNIFAEGTLGSLTGKGGGLKRPAGGAIAVDDPAKPEEALSPVESEKLKRWFVTTLLNRRNSSRWCPIVICAQRLGPEDLPGHIMETYPNNCLVLKFPAMVNGESIIPETITTEALNSLKATRYGRFVLASQYMQEPTALGGNLIPTDEFMRYDPATARGTDWEMMVITVDTAMKIKQANDFSCAQLWGLKDRRIYLIDMLHGKWESPALLANVIQMVVKTRADFPMMPLRCVIEEKAAGTGLLQQMQVAGVPAEGIERDVDKVKRVQAVLPFIESHCVYLPKDDSVPWVAKLLTELGGFRPDGTHTHDDMVDPLVDAIDQLLGRALSILDVLGIGPKK